MTKGRRLRVVLLAALAATISVCPPVGATASSGSAPHPDWQSYVESPPTRLVQPKAVLSTSGQVTDAAALVTPSGDDQTTLTYSPGGTAPILVLDFGQEVGGFPFFDVAAVTAVPTLQVGYSETLANLTTTGDMVNETNPFGQRFDVLPIATPGMVSGATIQGGERYEMITLAAPGSVTLRSVGIRFSGYLGTPAALRGWFESSDDLLNRVWYAGVYTVNLNQVLPGTAPGPQGTDADLHLLLDGAKRDRSVWVGDMAMSAKTVYTALDPVYVRDSLELVGRYPATVADYLAPAVGVQSQPGPMAGVCQPLTTTPTCLSYSVSYSTLFVPVLYEYYWHTGDKAFLRHEWPNLTRVLAWNASQRDGNGLLPTTSTNGYDWGVRSLTGEVTWTNLVYFEALTDAAELAAAVDPAAAAGYGQQAAALGRAINAHLWDPQLGLYDVSNTISGVVAQDANVFAVLSGLVPSDRARSILAKLDSTLAAPRGMYAYSQPAPSPLGKSISPFMSGFQVLADFGNGRGKQALQLIRTEWEPQIDGDPGGTTWENVPDTGGLGGGSSAAHSWASGPTAALSEYVLGVQPTSPGFSTLIVSPQPGGLDWAKGRVPTPTGGVDVSWTDSGCRFDLQVTLPPGTTGSVVVPGTSGVTEAVLDGAVVRRAGSSQDFQFSGLAPGSHTVSASQSICGG